MIEDLHLSRKYRAFGYPLQEYTSNQFWNMPKLLAPPSGCSQRFFDIQWRIGDDWRLLKTPVVKLTIVYGVSVRRVVNQILPTAKNPLELEPEEKLI